MNVDAESANTSNAVGGISDAIFAINVQGVSRESGHNRDLDICAAERT
jgi:hypothetical protein